MNHQERLEALKTMVKLSNEALDIASDMFNMSNMDSTPSLSQMATLSCLFSRSSSDLYELIGGMER